jgi:hypothetical protein
LSPLNAPFLLLFRECLARRFFLISSKLPNRPRRAKTIFDLSPSDDLGAFLIWTAKEGGFS